MALIIASLNSTAACEGHGQQGSNAVEEVSGCIFGCNKLSKLFANVGTVEVFQLIDKVA